MVAGWRQGVFLVVALSAGFGAPFAAADSWRAPEDIERTSPQGRYSVLIHRQEGAPVAVFEDRDLGESFNIPLPHGVFPVQAALLETGELVLFDEWHRLGYGELVTVCFARDERSGTWKKRWRNSLEDMLPPKVLDAVPRTVSSRPWRKSPSEWALRTKGSRRYLSITLHDENQLWLDMESGDGTWVRVDDSSLDPARLLSRAETLRREGLEGQAVDLVEKAIRSWGEVPPSRLRHKAGNILRTAENSERVIELLRPIVGPIPASDDVDSKDRDMSDWRWAWDALAFAHQNLGQWPQASAIWKHMMTGRHDPWSEVGQLARMLFSAGQDELAVEELEAYGETYVLGTDDKNDRKKRAEELGELLEERGYPELALQYLPLAWDPGSSRFWVGVHYAKALESVERPRAALDIWYVVRDKVGTNPYRGEEAREAIERLEAAVAQETVDP